MPLTDTTSENAGEPLSDGWNYTPTVPLRVSPYFRWPPRPMSVLRWFLAGWFPLTDRLLILILAALSSVYFQAELEQIPGAGIGWVIEILIRNLVLMILVAGGLHLYFYVFKVQGNERRFDARPFATSSKVFTFGAQVHDNIFWTLVSGVSIWTLYEAALLWALAHGFAPQLELPSQWPWLVVLVLLIPLWETTHFFLIHRLIHSSSVYRRVHAVHHRNTNVGPWSGLSMHPLEHVVYLSTVLVHFVVPSTPFLIAFHLMYFALSAATTHTGYQGILFKGRLILSLGTFHHQLHHRYFTCNYGGLEVPWDRWTGSFHDGTRFSHDAHRAQRNARK